MDKDDDESDETAGKSRFPCLPSLIALQQMRNRLNLARSGRRLMKWSALATGRELRRIAREITIIYDSFAEDVRDAFILIARCRYFYPNINKMVLQNYPLKACVTVGKSHKSIAGCKITTYEIEDNCPDSYPCLGIDKGGETILETKRVWHELLRRLIEIEQLRSNFITLDISHKNATKKQNVLGKIIIPRTQITIRYILSELEEMEREEFFRLKKVLEIKYRHKKKSKPGEPCDVCKEEEEEPPETVALPPPVPESCILCEGPMRIEGQKRILTDQQRKQESAVLAELKENLGKVLDATVEYEKTAKEKDSVKSFKQTTERLRQMLHIPPVCIPDHVDVEKLCELCTDIYDEQLAHTDCVVCGEPLKDSGNLAAGKESKRQLRKQLETILGVIQQYERDDMQNDKLREFKKTAADLKNKLQGPPIPRNVNINKLCSSCKERMNERDETVSRASSRLQPALKQKESKVSIKEPSEVSAKRVASVVSNTPSSGRSSDLPLGVFETEEITEIIQVRNPDGTISEKRRIITIRRKPGTGLGSSATSSFKDRKSVGHVVVHHRRGLMEQLPRAVHSDYAISSLPMVDRMVKECISSNFGYFDEVLESITEFAPRQETSYSCQTTAGGAEKMRGLVTSGSAPFNHFEVNDDDSLDSKTSKEKNSLTFDPSKSTNNR